MSKQVKRCGAPTTKRKPCQNAAQDEYGGFCAYHGKKKSRPNQSSLDNVGKVVGLGANFIAVAGGVHTAVTYISIHWDAIRHALSTLGFGFATKDEPEPERRLHFGSLPSTQQDFEHNRMRGLAQEAKDLAQKCHEILRKQECSEAEALELRREFSYWFKGLPDDVRQRAQEHLGKNDIDNLIYP